MEKSMVSEDMHSVFPAKRQEAKDGPARRDLGHYLSQTRWYALSKAGEIAGLEIRKNHRQALCFLPESARCNTVNPDMEFVFWQKVHYRRRAGMALCQLLVSGFR